MSRISRRRLLGGLAATSLPVALPEAAAGMDDVSIVRMLVDAHKAAMERYDNTPEGEVPDDIISQMMRTGAALCDYRPTTLEGVHRKAGYMVSCDTFVGGETSDADFTAAELVRGFLPAAISDGMHARRSAAQSGDYSGGAEGEA